MRDNATNVEKMNFKYQSLLIICIIAISLILIANSNLFLHKQKPNFQQKELIDNYIFGDNITGYPINIVPNIVHYVLFNIKQIEFGHFISILSVLRNQKPDQIIVHCDCDHLIGDYYERILQIISYNFIIK